MNERICKEEKCENPLPTKNPKRLYCCDAHKQRQGRKERDAENAPFEEEKINFQKCYNILKDILGKMEDTVSAKSLMLLGYNFNTTSSLVILHYKKRLRFIHRFIDIGMYSINKDTYKIVRFYPNSEEILDNPFE